MFWIGLAVLIIFWVVVYPCSDGYLRRLAPGVLRRGEGASKSIYLSFDDGPDPLFTPQVLEILAARKVPAVFFLVAAKAEAFPQLVRAILAAGHEVGLHTWQHRHAYLLGYRSSRAAVREGQTRLAAVSGRKLTWFRPPWGATNLFQIIELQRLRLRVVLWSAEAHDWLAKTGPEGIINQLRRKVRPGAIIVLHDSGGDQGAPAQMIAALPQVIEHFQAEGYDFKSLASILGGEEHVGSANTARSWAGD